MKSEESNNIRIDWWFIKAKNNSCQGYMPASSKEEACQKFGVVVEESIIKSIIWNGREFASTNHSEQGRLL